MKDIVRVSGCRHWNQMSYCRRDKQTWSIGDEGGCLGALFTWFSTTPQFAPAAKPVDSDRVGGIGRRF